MSAGLGDFWDNFEKETEQMAKETRETVDKIKQDAKVKSGEWVKGGEVVQDEINRQRSNKTVKDSKML